MDSSYETSSATGQLLAGILTREVNLKAAPGLEALVVKPSLLGGLVGLCRTAEVASALRANVVVSSAFESGVGVAGMVHVASWLRSSGGGDVAQGLGTLTWLGDDVSSFKEKARTRDGLGAVGDSDSGHHAKGDRANNTNWRDSSYQGSEASGACKVNVGMSSNSRAFKCEATVESE